jgi:hypothetical protein
MHWAWKNCPSGWAGQFQGKEKCPPMFLEAVASKSLWIWHDFFGNPGALNNINILHHSHLFDTLLMGASDSIEYTIKEIFTRPATICEMGSIHPGPLLFLWFDTHKTGHQNTSPNFKKFHARISNKLLGFFRLAGRVLRLVLHYGKSWMWSSWWRAASSSITWLLKNNQLMTPFYWLLRQKSDQITAVQT